jgi:hypothetical protein
MAEGEIADLARDIVCQLALVGHRRKKGSIVHAEAARDISVIGLHLEVVSLPAAPHVGLQSKPAGAARH